MSYIGITQVNNASDISANFFTGNYNVSGGGFAIYGYANSMAENVMNINSDVSVNVFKGKTLDGSKFLFVTPKASFDTVYLWLHGYRFTIPLASDPGNLNAPEISPDNDRNFPIAKDILTNGAALIGTGLNPQGLNSDEGLKTAEELILLFKRNFPSTTKVIVWGFSIGGYISQMLNQKYPGLINASGLISPVIYKQYPLLNMGYNIFYLLRKFISNTPLISYKNIKDHPFTLIGLVGIIKDICEASIRSNNFGDASLNATYYGALNLNASGTINDFKNFSNDASINLITPHDIFSLIGIMLGFPTYSKNYTENSIARAMIDNMNDAKYLAVYGIADMELKLGGTLFKKDLSYNNFFTDDMKDLFNKAYNQTNSIDISFNRTHTDRIITKFTGFIDDASYNPVELINNDILTKFNNLSTADAVVNKVPTVILQGRRDEVTCLNALQEFKDDCSGNIEIEKRLATIWIYPPDASSNSSQYGYDISAYTDVNGNNYYSTNGIFNAMVHGPYITNSIIGDGVGYKVDGPPGAGHFNFVDYQLIKLAEVLKSVAVDGKDGISNGTYTLMEDVKFSSRDIVERGGEDTVNIPLVPLLAIPAPAVYP